MNNGERLLAVIVAYVLTAGGAAIAITQGSQVFWSQRYPHTPHYGSAVLAGFGLAVAVLGIIFFKISSKGIGSKK